MTWNDIIYYIAVTWIMCVCAYGAFIWLRLLSRLGRMIAVAAGLIKR